MVLNIDGKEIKIKYPADSKTPMVGQMIKFTERKQANARPWIYGSCEECNGECPSLFYDQRIELPLLPFSFVIRRNTQYS